MDEALHEQMLEARRNGSEDNLEDELESHDEKPPGSAKRSRS
jgi:hypothetical protein